MFEFSGVPGRKCAVGPRRGYTKPEPAPVITYRMSPEEIAAKYGPPRQVQAEKPSPLAALADPVIQQLKKRGGKHDSRGRQKAMETTRGEYYEEKQG